MRRLSAVLLALTLSAAAPQQQGQPINAMCPIKPNLKSRPTITVIYKGQVIGFC